VAALALALLPGIASALDATLQLLPTFGYTRDRTTGAVTSSSESWLLIQKYRLGLSQDLLTQLRLDANGFLNWDMGWTHANGAWTDTDRKIWNGDLRLSFGGQPLGGAAYFTRQQATSETTAAGVTLRLPELVRESTGFTLSWAPEGLPRLTLLYDRSHLTDVPRQARDTLSNSVLASAEYSPVRSVGLRYNLGYATGEDRLSGVTSDSLTQNAQVSWGDAFWERRLVVAASYQAQSTVIEAHAAGGTGSVQLPQVPQAGLSIVEPPTSLPDQIRLANTPALVDGNLTAGAGVDIGWGGSQTGDPRPRHVGAQFADPLTEVELLYVWVDRRLPPEVAGAFQWTAWRSDDGERWTSVALAGQVQFGAIDNRFEIPVAATRAPYVKVVVRPLPLGVTTDRQYFTILVTEVQLFRVSAVPAGGLRQTAYGGIGTASARLLLLPPWNLAYDFSGSFIHRSSRAGVDWSLSSGLSASQRLSAILEGRARLEHLMGRLGLSTGEVIQNDLRLTAGLDAGFLPTLRAALAYQGQVAFQGSTLSRSYNAVLLTATAEPYKGFSMSGNGSYTWGDDSAAHGTFTSATANVSASIVPNQFVTVTGGGAYSSSTALSPAGTHTTRSGQLNASLVVTPLPSLYASGSVTRYVWGTSPSTVYGLAANFSPLPGGQLLLNFNYSENLDVTNDIRTSIWGPSLRWTIRPATFLNASYSQARGHYPTYQTLSDGVFVSLMITI
jgi:hypothetical protein